MPANYNFKRYYALALIVIFGLFIVNMFKNFIRPIFAAIILTFLLYPVYTYLLKKTNNRKMLSAFIVLIGLFVLVVTLVAAFATIFVNQVNSINLNQDRFDKYEDTIFEITGKQISITESVLFVSNKLKEEVKNTIPKLISLTTQFLLYFFIMLFIMFYLFIEKDIVLKTLSNILPFSKENSSYLINESGKVTKAILIGQVLTAVIQGLLAMFAFYIVGMDSAFFWGVITILFAVVPMVGTFLVWLPIGLVLLLEGMIWQGIFVLLWGLLVVSQIDNIIRPKLVNTFANIHPLETFLGIIVGLSTFGIIGLFLGPLIVSLFKTLIIVYLREYPLH